MLYLAEVRKQKGGFMAKGATELKLLACQRNDQSWSAVQGDEVIAADEANAFEQGALVLVNLNNNRQVQSPPEAAGAQIVRNLERLSKLQDKIKTQEEEIEAWKQSLTLQAQELNKREMELMAELEQLEAAQVEADQNNAASAGVAEGASEELQKAKEEADRIREEFERKTQELEQAWAHLRGEQARFEERKGELAPGGVGIDPAQLNHLQELVNYLETTVMPTGGLREPVQAAIALLDQQKSTLGEYWVQLEEQRSDAQRQQTEVDEQSEALETRQQALQAQLQALETQKDQVSQQEYQVSLKQASLELLRQQQEQQSSLEALVARLDSSDSGESDSSGGVDVGALENMALEELQGVVERLEQDLAQLVRFVEDQEEELNLQREAVEEIQEKLKNASVYEASALEQELADEQEQKKLLDQTLIGQRRTLAERRSVLRQHLRVLRRRQGIPDENAGETGVDLTPLLGELATQQEATVNRLQALEEELKDCQAALEQSQGELNDQQEAYDALKRELEELEVNLEETHASTALLWGRVNLYEEILKPMQDGLEGVQQQLEAIAALLDQTEQTAQYQQEAVGNLQQAVNELAS
ncbi:pilus motility taxis protein HmpF [Spirulina subsalsa FACHB-351]|uniref:Pilus motility taxis protein HmpF n=1 Tax=Spirulina subsalsa FACHB-351 TaxID=234711 RepID=A0ABT3L8U8_9CYAN|nr:pilus motility taxis protein HmpF [Spirulina subsalsa]MCW6037935.1 pilus motility taxis protein HmpF [Spirulina subsalsa FACHB-351]